MAVHGGMLTQWTLQSESDRHKKEDPGCNSSRKGWQSAGICLALELLNGRNAGFCNGPSRGHGGLTFKMGPDQASEELYSSMQRALSTKA